MTDSISDISPDPAKPARRFQLTTHVTAEFLQRVEPELASVFLDCLTSRGRRFHDSTFSATLFLAVKLLSVFGLALSLVLLAMGGAMYHSVRLDLVFIALFALLLFGFWNKEKNTASLHAFYQPLWKWMASRAARRILKVAARTVPFDAEYDLRGNWLVYYRSKNGNYDFAWARKIAGLRVGGNGFTLFYKKEATIYPHAIVLHRPSAELESHLDAAGVRAAGQPSPTSST